MSIAVAGAVGWRSPRRHHVRSRAQDSRVTQAPRTCRCSATRSCASIRTIRRRSRRDCSIVDGVLYEGTGLVGQSSIRKVELETGKVLQQRDVPRAAFRRRHHRLEERSDRADVADARRVRLRPDDVRAEEAVQLSGRRLGPDARRHEPDHERRHRRAARARSRRRSPSGAASRSPPPARRCAISTSSSA